MLEGIKAAGGIGALKKVDRSKVRDRSAAMVPGNENSSPAGGSGTATASSGQGGGGGGLADALAQALNKRKQKVAASGEYFHIPTRVFDLRDMLTIPLQMMRLKRMIGREKGVVCLRSSVTSSLLMITKILLLRMFIQDTPPCHISERLLPAMSGHVSLPYYFDIAITPAEIPVTLATSIPDSANYFYSYRIVQATSTRLFF